MIAKPPKTAIIGVGRWGTRLAQRLHELGALHAWSTKSTPSAGDALLHGVSWQSFEDVCMQKDITHVVIATPPDSHGNLARTALLNGKHVLVEKPLAQSIPEATELVDIARAHEHTLMVGYVFLHNPLYRTLKEKIHTLTIRSIEMTWEKYGTFDESIEWNLLTHHFAYAFDLLGKPASITSSCLEAQESTCDELRTSLSYDDATCSSYINRLSETKKHVLVVTCTDGTVFSLENNELLQEEKAGVITTTHINETDALSVELETFLYGSMPCFTDGQFGLEVLKMHQLLDQGRSSE